MVVAEAMRTTQKFPDGEKNQTKKHFYSLDFYQLFS